MSFKLAMKQKTTLSCDDHLSPGVSINRSNHLSAESLSLERKNTKSNYDLKTDLIYSEILSQNQKSNYQNLNPSSIFLIRKYARQFRLNKALELRLRNLGRGPLINIM